MLLLLLLMMMMLMLMLLLLFMPAPHLRPWLVGLAGAVPAGV